MAAAHVVGLLSLERAADVISNGFEGPQGESSTHPTCSLAEAIAGLAGKGVQIFVEIGPHPTTAALIKASVRSKCAEPLVLPSLRRGERGLDTLRSSAAFLYARGLDLDWTRVTPPGRLVRLPHYPWQRERYWIDTASRGPTSRGTGRWARGMCSAAGQAKGNGQGIGKYHLPAGASPEGEQAKLVHDIPGSGGGPEVAELEDGRPWPQCPARPSGR